ncbi:hypothetical protein GCM10010411_43770 [Actinomadura fulvescens]|uniref:Uncharacterized protein n=1 Tax=Actinomadura fulvescens TaxID=46160 RepID=A0ABN3PX26_9ACTN
MQTDTCKVVMERTGPWSEVAERLRPPNPYHSPRAGTITVSAQVGRRDPILCVLAEGPALTAKERHVPPVRAGGVSGGRLRIGVLNSMAYQVQRGSVTPGGTDVRLFGPG